MTIFLHKAWAFIKRDYRIESGYKTSFLMRVAESLMTLAFFYFLSSLINAQHSATLSTYGNRYFPFAMIGLAFARYFELTLKMFSESIRTTQVTGCLEAMLSTQTNSVTVVLFSSLYSLISGAVQLLVVLVAGVFLFGVDLSQMNIGATIVVVLLSMTIFVAFGVLSAAAIIWLKKGDPITWLLGSIGGILAGAYFPVDVMPPALQTLSLIIPIRYSLDALRLTMLRGYSLSMISRPLLTLAVMAVVLMPLSLILFSAMVKNGRKEGTLMQY